MHPSTIRGDVQHIPHKGINEYIRSHQELSREDLAAHCGISVNAVDHRERAMGIKRPRQLKEKTKESLDQRRERLASQVAASVDKTHLKEALAYIDQLEKEREALFTIKRTPQTYTIKERVRGDGKSEAVAFMVASDWHIEEPVLPSQVNDMNEYNLEISKERATKFFQNGLRLVKLFQADTKIRKLVIPLLGDFFSNTIHEELAEANLLMPGDAAWRVQQYLSSGIRFMLDNSDLEEVVLICHSGNHGRMTKKVRISTESGNSLETYMYRNMAESFKGEPRLKWVIAEGQHTYLDVYDLRMRFLHGHSIKFGGGVGGITIPVRKALAQWDRVKKADITVFGHFHQFLDGGNFIANGSLIGYNAFAQFIKADYERPQQAFFLVSNYQGGTKSIVAPIYVV